MQLNEVSSSAVKLATLGLGTVTSFGAGGPSVIPPWLQWLAFGLTVAYGALQIIKAMPWFTDYCVAAWMIVRRWDWSRWWKIAGRDEEGESKK